MTTDPMAFKPVIIRIAFLILIVIVPLDGRAQTDKPLSLEACIQYAIENNINVRQNQLTQAQTAAQLKQSKLERLPSLNAGAGQGFRFGRSIDPFTNEFVQQTIRSNNFSLNSNVDLFQGFQQNRRIKGNTRQLQADRAQVEAGKNTIRTEVASRYLEVLLQRQNKVTAEEQLATSQSQMEQARVLVESGKAPKTRLLEVKAQVAEDRSRLVEAKNQLALAKLNLRQYMNWNTEDGAFELKTFQLPDSLDPLPEKPVSSVVQENFQKLPKMEQARYNLEAARYQFKAAKSGRYPTLTFNAQVRSGFSSRRQTPTGVERTVDTVGFVASSQEPVVRPGARPILETPGFVDQMENNFSQLLNFNLNIPLFNNWQVENQIVNARIQKEQAALNLAQRKQNVRQAIHQAYAQAQNAYEQHLAALQQLEAQETLFQQADDQYEEGAIDFYAWRNAKQDYTQAQNNYLQAKYQYLFNKKLYAFYLGQPLRLNP